MFHAYLKKKKINRNSNQITNDNQQQFNLIFEKSFSFMSKQTLEDYYYYYLPLFSYTLKQFCL